MTDGHSDALPSSPPPWETLTLTERLDAAKRLFKERKNLAGWLGIAQTFLPQVCDRYRANGNWQAFYTELTSKTSKFLGVMDDALRDPIPRDLNELRVANAGHLLEITFKGYAPSTAHEAVWDIGYLIAHAYNRCKDANDLALGETCEVANAKLLHDELKALPFVRNKIEDRLAAESARWQRWLIEEAEKQSPKPVERQTETLAGGDDEGGRQQSSLPPRDVQHKVPVSGNYPANMATIVLLTVNQHETQALLDEFVGERKSPQHETKGNVTYNNLGSHGGCQIVHTLCEMGSGGMGASQQRTRQAIDHWQPQAIIAVGVAFGMDESKQKFGDVLVSTHIQNYDLGRVNEDGTLTPRGDKPSCSHRLLNHFRVIDTNEQRRDGEWPKVRFGLVLSGQKLVDNLDYRESLKRLFTESIGGEMEGSGVYVSAHEKKIDWIVVKAICDWGHNKNDAEKDAWQRLAAKNAARVLKAALDAGGLYET